MVAVKTTYLTIDGQEFEHEADAVAHEAKRAKSIKKHYDQFVKSDKYSSLLRQHKLDEVGIWLVRSEEFQTIGHVSGKLENSMTLSNGPFLKRIGADSEVVVVSKSFMWSKS
jgi:hypothetical protein